MRISVISNTSAVPGSFDFAYSAQFQHRWTQFFLHSDLRRVHAGANSFQIGGCAGSRDHRPWVVDLRGTA